MIPLTARFERFLDKIQPTQPQRDLAKDEFDFLEQKLGDFISDGDPFDFVKALRSGSYAKATMLRRHAAGDFDADLAVYVRAADGAGTPISELLDYLEGLLRRAYKERAHRKPVFDREPKSCVRVRFEITPKINIDVVPVVAIEHSTIPNWGAIPRRDGEMRLTSVTEHIEFVRSRNKKLQGVAFHQQVRLWKWWRNHILPDDEQDKVSTFLLELVVGKASDETLGQLTGNALDDLSKQALWIQQHGLKGRIEFPDNRVAAATAAHAGPVVVLDPMNLDNNVAHGWTELDRTRFVDRVQALRDVLRDAQIEDTVSDPDEAARFLDQVFPHFSEWSEDE